MVKLESTKRIYKICNSDNMDDEIHFLLECQIFTHECIHLLNEVDLHIEELTFSNKISTFRKIMSSSEPEVIKSLGKFVYTSLKRRLELFE